MKPPSASTATWSRRARSRRRSSCWTTSTASRRSRSPAWPGGRTELTGFYGSIDPAIRSFQLALRARGLGSTITGFHLFGHEEEVARLLGISEGFTQVALLPVAYTTQKDFQPAARPPVEEITYLDRWGARVS
ncbi:nitroreductase family protein [Amycolatopsis sp. ATCC 39116]|uniref:nitroreductase family protein n=1 Tax=Amycolatopsis sp. (strain ATCC 39116 / 75iv2) TaxID=385957 RepID=UPI0002625AAB